MTRSPSSPSTTPLKDQLKAQQALLGLSNQELCQMTGFASEAALRLVKEGAMRLPLTAIPAFASALDLDPSELFKSVMLEASPELAAFIESMFNSPLSSTAAINLTESVTTPLQAPPAVPQPQTVTVGAAA